MSAKLKMLKNGREISSIEIHEGEEVIGGRGDTCQIVLDDDAISRHHFKIFKDDRGWVLERLSKFGVLYHGEDLVSSHVLEPYDSFSIPPFHFLFEIAEAQRQEEVEPLAEPEISNDETTAEILEVTSTESSRVMPFLTVTSGGIQETLRLEGVAWIGGRDESCEIQITDLRASRRHFKIYKDESDYYIQDLKSSNGTLLNDKTLTKNPVRLDSGDQIVVGSTAIKFDLKDPLLEQEINQLPPAVVYMPVGLAPSSAGGGAVRIDPVASSKAKRTKQIRIVLATLALFVVVYSFMSEEGSQQNLASKGGTKSSTKDPFDSLNAQDQEFVRRTYKLAENLYMQTKYELALSEIRKLHEKVPSFQRSKEIENLAQAALQSIANRKYEEDIERKQKEALDRATKVVSECTTRYARSTDIAAIEACLAPALEIDPENRQARKLVENAKALIEQKELERNNRAEYKKKIKQREALYRRARELQTKGRYLDALDAYQRHIASSLPDPNNLEDQAKRGVDSIKEQIKVVMDSSVAEAEAHIANSEYKEAIAKLETSLELDPNNKKARGLYDSASKELFKKMKALFSDSVVEESLGNVESAKTKWRKIVELDIPKGEYRNKAMIKLRKYGE